MVSHPGAASPHPPASRTTRPADASSVFWGGSGRAFCFHLGLVVICGSPRNANEGTFVSALKERGEENEEAF